MRRAGAAWLVLAVLGFAAGVVLSASAAAPPGATALCKDGTYSFSQTHSGTCSSHGGVAEWLDGSATTTAPTPAPSTTTTPAATTTTAATTTASTPTTTAATATTATTVTSFTTPTTNSSPPAGATARCVDGSYSFSLTHSGTCSHHGGVTAWLDGSTPSSGGTATGGSGSSTSSGTATSTGDVGKTVLLTPDTRTSGCTLGANPDLRCSPGAYYSKLTTAVICSSSFRTSTIRNVPESEKHAVEQEYGLTPGSYGSTLEIDHIVSLELGGSNDIANLFPEKADAHPGYRVKDKLENALHHLVCSGAMTLHAAQTGIAGNWQALYKHLFGAPPA